MATEQMFTELPTVSNAQMTDIICAVQGYISPTVLGTSVQETLGQIFNLFQTNIVLFNAGNPNGALAGSTFQLCWDTTNMILYVCTTSGTSSTAVWTKSITLTAGTGISVSQSGNDIQIAATGSIMSWNDITGISAAMEPNNGYMADNAALVTLTLPTSASFGTSLMIIGQGTGGWTIAQGSGQQIIVGDAATTLGAGGSLASTNQYDSINLLCTVADTTWTALGGPQGILTIV